MNTNAFQGSTLAGLKRLMTLNLQNKILLLVLVPLIISSSFLLVLEGLERIDSNSTQLARILHRA